jgi:hypothetical protein
MFKVQQSRDGFMKAQVFDFVCRCIEAAGAVDVGEVRAGMSGCGLDDFVVGYVLGSKNFDVVADEGRLFFRPPTDGGGGCLDYPLRISGFAHRYDAQRKGFVYPPHGHVPAACVED